MKTRQFADRVQRPRSKYRTRHRRAAFEHLENRRVLTVDFASVITGGSTIADINVGDVISDLAVDSTGNTVVVGRFAGTVDFDPGAGTYELTSDRPDTRMNFTAKYDPNGNLLWAKSFRCDSIGDNGLGREIAVDNTGNAYIAGSFTGTTNLGFYTLTSFGDLDAFVTKIDVNGNFVWAKQFGSISRDFGTGLAVDSAGDVFLSATSYTTSSLYRGAPADALIAKITSDGVTTWTKAIGSSSSIPSRGNKNPTGYATAGNIAVDGAGAICFTGYMGGTVDFDVSSNTTAITGLGFVAKLNADGGLAFARAFTPSSGNFAIMESADIIVDAAGNIYSTGSYSGTIDFDPGTLKSQKYSLYSGTTNSLDRATYVSALDASGNFQWAKSTRCVSISEGNSGIRTSASAIAADGLGGIYVAGSFDNTIDFDPGAGTFALASTGILDGFIWKLNTGGTFEWAGQVGGVSSDFANAIDVDSSGNIIVGGSFTDTADLDPGTGTYTVTSNGGRDFFLLKLTQTTALASSASSTQSTDQLLVAETTVKRHRATLDSAFASLSLHSSNDWNNSLDEELLLALSSN